ncbi:hypothetical protein BKA69DRAFT_1037459 [Paraphysoderma sedebokerense]|nr:hypothetical protein BKA69DRAFT_1037459 [Paraphysoderma sedebokerense]
MNKAIKNLVSNIASNSSFGSTPVSGNCSRYNRLVLAALDVDQQAHRANRPAEYQSQNFYMEIQYHMPYYLNGDVWLLADDLDVLYNVPGYARQGERSILYRDLNSLKRWVQFQLHKRKLHPTSCRKS